MDVLIALEPCHLSFGIVDAVARKLFDHFLFVDQPAEMSTDPSVFESEIVEPFPTDTTGMETFDLGDHAGADALL